MAEIKGISYGDDSTKFISTNGGMIEGNFVVGGNLAVEGNLSYTEPEPEFKIVSFMDGTDEELAAMINAHYNDEIDIRDYWHVGDTRTLHLYATSGSENNSAAHAEQDMTIVIVAFNHDNLVEPINGHTTAAVSIACREVLGNNGKAEQEWIWGKFILNVLPESASNVYSKNPLRTYLNDIFVNSMPAAWVKIIKKCNKSCLSNRQYNGSEKVKDKAWLPSLSELFGNTSWYQYETLSSSGTTLLYYCNSESSLEEGQYPYYATQANIKKTINNNGTAGTATKYWTRSPSYKKVGYSGSTYRWDVWSVIETNGSGSLKADMTYDQFSICPHFAI